MEAARGQKHPSEAKNGMKESIYGKKCLMKVSHQPQKPPDAIRFELRPQIRKIQPPTSEVTVAANQTYCRFRAKVAT